MTALLRAFKSGSSTEPPGELDASSFVLGAFLNVAGSITINLGTTLLKYSHIQAEKQEKIKQARLHPTFLLSHQWWWRIGFSIFALGNVLNFTSFSFAAQSLLAGLGSVQFVTNVIFSYFILGSFVTPKVITSTGIIIMGNILIVLFGNQQDVEYTTDELLELYTTLPYIIYVSVIVGLVLAIQLLYMYLTKKQVVKSSGESEKSDFLRECTYDSVDVPEKKQSTSKKMIPYCYAAVSGMIGTQSVALAKSCSEIMRSTISGRNQLGNPFTYVIFIGWAAAMSFWLYRMNSALKKFDGLLIVPILQVIWIIFSVIGGGIYFQEFNDFELIQYALFFSGIFIVICGVSGLAPEEDPRIGWRRKKSGSISSLYNYGSEKSDKAAWKLSNATSDNSTRRDNKRSNSIKKKFHL